MIMFYKIKDNYYVLVGNKYIEVKFTVKNGEVQASPINGKYIERSQNIEAKPQPFNEEFQNKIKENEKRKGFGINKSDSRNTNFKDRI